jgi:hypothetical protein
MGSRGIYWPIIKTLYVQNRNILQNLAEFVVIRVFRAESALMGAISPGRLARRKGLPARGLVPRGDIQAALMRPVSRTPRLRPCRAADGYVEEQVAHSDRLTVESRQGLTGVKRQRLHMAAVPRVEVRGRTAEGLTSDAFENRGGLVANGSKRQSDAASKDLS